MTDVDSEGPPDWRDASAGGGLVRAAAWLLQEVGEGEPFTKAELRAAFPDIAQIDRRVRDLRDYGWIIDTSREDPKLSQDKQRFVKRGLDVWDPEQRKLKPTASSRGLRTSSVPQTGEAAGADAEELANQVAALTARERTRLLAWITMGERPKTSLEELWEQYLQLPPAGKQKLALQLARLLGEDSQGEAAGTSPT
ncbi:hypothetical protein [Streptomyces sp. NPDC053560]|uniref:hypothetical protein n=1 Tax=Streptomyces sp. NPDC053560 TaxID=3365711 RepID=UPI0037CE262A